MAMCMGGFMDVHVAPDQETPEDQEIFRHHHSRGYQHVH